MYEPKPVAYCILDADMEKCEHIAYGAEDAPADSVMLYDQYSVKRLQNDIEALYESIRQLHDYIASTTQPEATMQAVEALPKQEYKKIVYVKVKRKEKMEIHSYVNSVEEDNATIIANVRKDMKEAGVDVENVFVVEKD